MSPTDDKRTLVATRLGEIRPTGLGGHDLTYQSRQIGDARKDLPNVWLDVNTFKGVRLAVKNLISGVGGDGDTYDLSPLDYEVSIDAANGDFTFNLPFALANGQEFKVKRTDNSSSVVSIVAQPGELIDGDSVIFLLGQYDFVGVIDGKIGVWNKQGSIGGIIPADIARLSVENQFLAVNNFTGVRFATRTVSATSDPSEFQITELDYEIVADATDGPIPLTLPPSTGRGQIFRVKKKDETNNTVTIAAVGGDLIDGSVSIILANQWVDGQVQDAELGYWDDQGTSSGESGLTPPVVENPVGDINGINTDFTTSQDFEQIAVYLNGLRLQPGATKDYVVTDVNTFSMTSAPQVDDSLLVEYFSEAAAEIPPPDSSRVRYVTAPGPPTTVSLQIKNSSDVWETIWTESAST